MDHFLKGDLKNFEKTAITAHKEKVGSWFWDGKQKYDNELLQGMHIYLKEGEVGLGYKKTEARMANEGKGLKSAAEKAAERAAKVEGEATEKAVEGVAKAEGEAIKSSVEIATEKAAKIEEETSVKSRLKRFGAFIAKPFKKVGGTTKEFFKGEKPWYKYDPEKQRKQKEMLKKGARVTARLGGAVVKRLPTSAKAWAFIIAILSYVFDWYSGYVLNTLTAAIWALSSASLHFCVPLNGGYLQLISIAPFFQASPIVAKKVVACSVI